MNQKSHSPPASGQMANVNGVEIDLMPNEGMRTEAQRYRDWKSDGEGGGTDVARTRASQILGGNELSADTVVTMSAWFARHEVDKQGKEDGKDREDVEARVNRAVREKEEEYTKKLDAMKTDHSDNLEQLRKHMQVQIDALNGNLVKAAEEKGTIEAVHGHDSNRGPCPKFGNSRQEPHVRMPRSVDARSLLIWQKLRSHKSSK